MSAVCKPKKFYYPNIVSAKGHSGGLAHRCLEFNDTVLVLSESVTTLIMATAVTNYLVLLGADRSIDLWLLLVIWFIGILQLCRDHGMKYEGQRRHILVLPEGHILNVVGMCGVLMYVYNTAQ